MERRCTVQQESTRNSAFSSKNLEFGSARRERRFGSRLRRGDGNDSDRISLYRQTLSVFDLALLKREAPETNGAIVHSMVVVASGKGID
jgi:hypothetical protein